MKSYIFYIPAFLLVTFFNCGKLVAQGWLSDKQKAYDLFYTSADQVNLKEYKTFVEKGIKTVKAFFNSNYKKRFAVYIHPSRQSLDSTWQKDWGMPDFKSECWMVASGISGKLDMISPKLWDKESCDHIYAEKEHTQQLITHELVHVYHGQHNVSPDFSSVEGIDWFVEGLATYASGQCDASRMAGVKKAIRDNIVPKSLDKFWTGTYRYGLSGSLVMFIDHKYGRTKLTELLPLNKKSGILSALNTTEGELLEGWQNYMMNY